MTSQDNLPYAEVIGDPISQSKSPQIHGFWLQRLDIEARYGARQVSPETLETYITARRADPSWRGCNVTMPLKQVIVPFLDRVEPQAMEIGAVNTVYREGDQLIGTNTDVAGFLEPLRDVLAQQNLFRMARIIGSGGAARAIISALKDHNFTLVIAARNVGKARTVLKELGVSGEHYTAPLPMFAKPTDFDFDDRQGCLDLIVNASPLGMRGQSELEFDLTHAPPGSIFYDIVTDPPETNLLANAREAGFQTIDGFRMLVGQAATAFERFFDAKPPREHDDDLIKRLGG